MFMHICLHLDDVITPGVDQASQFCSSKFFYSRLQYDSLEGLMDF